MAEFHSAWVDAEAQREALANEWLEDYWVCMYNEIPESDIAVQYHFKKLMHTFVFKHRADDIPEGKDRWEYLMEL